MKLLLNSMVLLLLYIQLNGITQYNICYMVMTLFKPAVFSVSETASSIRHPSLI